MSFLHNLPEATNSLQSQKFGRRVYQIEQGEQTYWLKLQLLQSNSDYMHSFMHELEIYNQLNRLESISNTVIGNFSIFNPTQHFKISEKVIESALWIEDVQMLFDQAPSQLNTSEIYLRLCSSLDVLGNLHELGFVHGDLKVEHFRKLVDGASLIDFEQTHLVNATNRNIPNTATPRYMAPELFHAKHKSFQSDIYALGIIWLEWLSEQRLSAKSYRDWAILHCQQLMVRLPERFIQFEEVLTQMLMKKREQRCTNIYQIKQQLSQIV